MRVKRGTAARKRHKKMIKAVKGYSHIRRSSYRKAKEAWIKAQTYAYRDRRNRKRDFRGLWITRINAAARQNGLSYSQLINLLAKNNVKLDRKILSEVAFHYPESFKAIVDTVKK
ncbi:50S ribosomal protein L20 [Candidatus Saccharibacteria bacterium]|nr:50S ribosomal protein L20 [Candidatus Saccharibacteria bacterium]